MNETEIRERVVAEARSWTGTPYHDHAGVKGAGVDCAFFPLRTYQGVGLLPKDFAIPAYSPQQWLNSPSQTDKMRLRVVDTTMLDIVSGVMDEIAVDEVRPGDLMLVKIVNSWTHAAVVVEWPGYVLHPVKGKGVIASHALQAGFWKVGWERRYFSIVRKFLREHESIQP